MVRLMLRSPRWRANAALVAVVGVLALPLVALPLVVASPAWAQTAPNRPSIKLVKVDGSLPGGSAVVPGFSPLGFGTKPVYEFQVWNVPVVNGAEQPAAQYATGDICVSWKVSAVTPSGVQVVDQNPCSKLGTRSNAPFDVDWGKLPAGTTSFQVEVQLFSKGPSDQPGTRYPAPIEFPSSVTTTGFPAAATTTTTNATPTTTTTTSQPATTTTSSSVVPGSSGSPARR